MTISDSLTEFCVSVLQVLVVGCGNSELSEQLYDVGYKHLTNIDISETVVTHMNQRNAERRPGLTFQQVDATQTPYENASYQATLDKGTLDAMASEEEGALARNMLTEVRNQLGRVSTDHMFFFQSVHSSFPVSAGGSSAKCWWPVRLCDVGSGECDKVGCGALCSDGVGGEAPLPAGGKWERRGLLCSACLCSGLHQVSSAYAHAYSRDVSRGRWSPYSSHTGSRVVDGCEGASGVLCLEKEAPYRHRRHLEPLTHSLPRQDRPSQIHSHSTRLPPRCQGLKIKPVCYFYW